MRWFAVFIVVVASGCSDERKKQCFTEQNLSACNELCDGKGDKGACGKAELIRMDLCLKKGDRRHCDDLCRETGIDEFCIAAGVTAAPVTGPVTKDAIMAAKVTTGEEYDAARQRLRAALGKSVYHDTRLQWWGVLEGEDCYGIAFQWKGDWVGEVVGPGPMEGELFPHCKAAAYLNECAKTKKSSDCRKDIELPEVWRE